MTRRSLSDILADFWEMARERDETAHQGVLIRREHAAQLAEQAWRELTSTGEDRSAEWLDGCMAGVEKAAEIIRRGQIRSVT